MSNLFWGNHLRCFGDKISLDEPLVLSRSFRTKTTQSTTAITSIVVAKATNLKIKCESLQKFLLLFAFAKSRVSLFSCHCESESQIRAKQSK